MTSWTLKDLKDALVARGSLPTTMPAELSVIDVSSGATAGTLVLDIESTSDDDRQRWRLTLENAMADLAEEKASLESAALIVRANVEEWWHLKDVEPATGRMAVRISS